MNIEKTNRINKKISILIIISIVLLGTLAFAFYVNNHKTDSQTGGVDYSSPTDDQKQNGQDIKLDSINGNNEKPGEPYNSENEPTHTGGQNTVGVEITRADVINGNIKVGTIIQEISSTGSCTLTLEKDGQVSVTQVTDVQTISDYTTCKGFTVPTNSLPKGVWRLSVRYVRGSVVGTSSREVIL